MIIIWERYNIVWVVWDASGYILFVLCGNA